MAHIHANFFAQTLNKNTDVDVILPTLYTGELLEGEDTGYFHDDMRYQVLYLLHGTWGDYSDWCRHTCIERYAQMHKLAVVMPTAENSFYQNMAYGPKYLSFLTEELPLYVNRLFPISKKREDTFIAGLSMGGYGAWHVALTKPEQYMAAASLSGVLDLRMFIDEWLNPNKASWSFQDDTPWSFKAIFGEQKPEDIKCSHADLMVQIEDIMKNNKELPKLFHTVGTEDFTYANYQSAKKRLRDLGVPVDFEEHSGQHDWAYWDTHIQRVLEWLPLKNTTI